MRTEETQKPGLMGSVLSNKCPRCRRGPLFKHQNPYKLNGLMAMNNRCPVCGQSTEMEPGFYYDTSYVSYALAVTISVATLVAWWLFIGLSLNDNRFFWWMGTNALILIILQPVLMRLSRTIWLAFFIRYSARWQEKDVIEPERVNDGLKNAW